MKNSVALVDLKQIDENSTIYLSPAGNASEKFFRQLEELRSDIKVKGYIDTYKSGQRAGVDIYKLSDIEAVIDEPVVVLIERKALQRKIIQELEDKGVKSLFYVDYSTNFYAEEPKSSGSTLYFFYDLSVNALNFEYLNSLCHAESIRLKLGFDYIHPVIVPQHSHSVFDLSRTAVTGKQESDNSWFMDNVVVPANSLLSSIYGLSLFRSRIEVDKFQKLVANDVFPQGYSVTTPIELDSSRFLYDESNNKDVHQLPFRATSTAKIFVQQWLSKYGIDSNSKIVVITLREVAYQTERNSDISVWKEYAEEINKLGYTPVFIRDTYAAFNDEDFSGFHVFHEAAWNIFLRIAIYELAFLNMMSCTGPHVLCTYNRRTRYIIFNTLTDEGYVGSKEYLEAGGVQVGEQYFARGAFQHAVWGMDKTSDSIMKEFLDMASKINNFGS